jgi:hypothetical protein
MQLSGCASAGGPRRSDAARARGPSVREWSFVDGTLDGGRARHAPGRHEHLHVLAGAGLVRGTRMGRDHFREIAPTRLSEARRWLDHIAGQWAKPSTG